MDRLNLTVTSNRPIATGIWEMKLSGCTSTCNAGQFVNIMIDGLFLRRPISVCNWDNGTLTLAYRVVGKGTEAMSKMTGGETLEVLAPLGNGFSTEKDCKKPLLLGGGIGVAPLYKLAKELSAKGLETTVICGYKRADEIFYKEEFEALPGVKLIIATEDGSAGIKGFVTNAMEGLDCDWFYACGPMPMLRAVKNATTIPGEVSLEERMGCGFGICMGCTCHTVTGGKRICKEGPVFNINELVW